MLRRRLADKVNPVQGGGGGEKEMAIKEKETLISMGRKGYTQIIKKKEK